VHVNGVSFLAHIKILPFLLVIFCSDIDPSFSGYHYFSTTLGFEFLREDLMIGQRGKKPKKQWQCWIMQFTLEGEESETR
jgi:hypothetical protein